MEYVKEYNLADRDFIKNAAIQNSYLVWQPSETCIVLGRSNNNVEDAVFLETAIKDNVSIYQRQTGGQSVVLSPHMLAISIVQSAEELIPSKEHFRIYNNIIISALKELGVQNLDQKGISDIVIQDKKIAGTAMYRNKDKVFYHAILNICEDITIFEHYLKYPSKVPDYRKNRKHSDFITSLQIQGFTSDIDAIKTTIEKHLYQYFIS